MQQEYREIKNRLAAAYRLLKAEKMDAEAEKVKELAGKFTRGEYGIAFCGHFSAGKSRMLNVLLGEALLPSSPIPTSANLVKIKAGEAYAKVFFHKGRPRKYLAPYDYETIKSCCQDGDRIASIELSRMGTSLPAGAVLMDTPGIDSADDAHRLATEAAIHLADLVFYVMDYNHVQSELNFRFARDLAEAGKELCLVVNQIDKHVEKEVPFAVFRQGIANAFAAWGVHPVHIFYTSMKEMEHPENEFKALQDFLAERLAAKDRLLPKALQCSLQSILRQGLKEQQERQRVQLQADQAAAGALSKAEQQQLCQENQALQAEKAVLMSSDAATEFVSGVRKILDNAYLMPYETRALAESYLVACQPDFKMGWLFAAKKTAEERRHRLLGFQQAVMEKAQAQLVWHLQRYLQAFWETFHLSGNIPELVLDVPVSLLEDAVREGARISQDGAYVIKYTENVAEAVKRLAKRQMDGILQRILPLLQEEKQVHLQEVEDRLLALAAPLQAMKAMERAEKRAAARASRFQHVLQDTVLPEDDLQELFVVSEEAAEIVPGGAAAKQLAAVRRIQTAPLPSAPAKQAQMEHAASGQLQRWAARLQRAADAFAVLPGFTSLSRGFAMRAERMEKRQFTVTLFGAFSAGKSSFANALLGHRLLPVSPNPTTAAVNKILPVDAEHPHGTVRVQLKDGAMLLEDINRALAAYGEVAATLSEARQKAGKIAGRTDGHSLQQAFLRAFCEGYAELAERAGTVLETDLTGFSQYAAAEEKSCFVEWIALYYDCPFTRQGITLVDTPGADSVNARHTETAFSFIRNADVILFVTYYNHAFSHADREFLLQLGRVKDAFQLDKMFFVVNAIDLADNEAEQTEVVSYVRHQLQRYGVQQPQLYALSSQSLLQEKERGERDASGFEEAFYHFVLEELSGLAVVSARAELEKARGLLAEMMAESTADEARKKQRQQLLAEERQKALAILAGPFLQDLLERLQQETDELLYYVKQRVFLRFAEFYREAFNPADLCKGPAKALLQNALQQLLDHLGFDFAQEMRATTMRLENFLSGLLTERQGAYASRLQAINRRIMLPAWEEKADLQLPFAPAFTALDLQHFWPILKRFKNPQAFFEQGGSQQMAEALQAVLLPEADRYLAVERKRLVQKVDTAVTQLFGMLQQQNQQSLQEIYAGFEQVLSGGIALETLQKLQRSLQA